MSDIKKFYGEWSKIYDTNINKTRDLDLEISNRILSNISFKTVLEIGCGTGKNTIWLSEIASSVTAVDFSYEMLNVARKKDYSNPVNFVEMDITKPWDLNLDPVDLISFNLVLEHVENMEPIFNYASKYLKENKYLFISELHPFKQYLGSQAKFGDNLVQSYTHHISEYISSAKKNNLICIDLIESFDTLQNDENSNIPRLLSILFKKN